MAAAVGFLVYWHTLSSGMGRKGCCAWALVTFALVRCGLEWQLSPSAVDVASTLQRLQPEQLPTQPGSAAGAAATVGMPAGVSTQQSGVRAGACKLYWLVVWLVSFVPWALGRLVALVCCCLFLLLGAVVGIQLYVHAQAAQHTVRYLACVLHFWSLAMAITVVTWMLRPWPWMQDPATGLLSFAAVLVVLLQQGSKVCADLQDKCSNHLGSKLSVVSVVCFDQGIALVVEVLLPFLCVLWSGVVDTTVGAWVVCLAVHGKPPWSL